MKIELTARDKKLLTFLGVFVIIVCIGYWGVLPQLKAANENKDAIEEQQLVQDVYQQKINNLILVQSNNDELEKLISGAKENYYPMMNSDSIDHLITNKVIDEYNLMTYDLEIEEKQLAGLLPYIYSEKSITGKSDARDRALKAAAPIISEDGMLLFGEVAEADNSTIGIYCVRVSMRLGGDMKNITKLLDDLAYSEKKLRLVNYSIEKVETIIPHEDGTEPEVIVSDNLNLVVELYMCAE